MNDYDGKRNKQAYISLGQSRRTLLDQQMPRVVNSYELKDHPLGKVGNPSAPVEGRCVSPRHSGKGKGCPLVASWRMHIGRTLGKRDA